MDYAPTDHMHGRTQCCHRARHSLGTCSEVPLRALGLLHGLRVVGVDYRYGIKNSLAQGHNVNISVMKAEVAERLCFATFEPLIHYCGHHSAEQILVHPG
jgi:hypothetical protein